MTAFAMTTVDLAGVTLGYPGRVVLDDVSLSLRAGEFVGLLGPNGAGKTTLLRAVLGLVRPSKGSLRVLGGPATRGNPQIGYMPQVRAAAAGSRITGRDFVASAARGERWGLPIADAATRRDVARALELVDATGLARRALADLSGGERQRLLLAQALLGRPRLLLLDEPLISLDPRHQHSVVALVRRLQAELRMTVLFSAHELNALLGAMDRVLYLGGGQAAIGPVEEVVTGPVLSRLYGAEIEVVRAAGRIFVLTGGLEAEHDAHGHEDAPFRAHGHEDAPFRAHGHEDAPFRAQGHDDASFRAQGHDDAPFRAQGHDDAPFRAQGHEAPARARL